MVHEESQAPQNMQDETVSEEQASFDAAAEASISFTPQVTPPQERPFTARALREQRIKKHGWLKALEEFEALQRKYDESEGQDEEAENALKDQFGTVWGMVTEATTGAEKPPRMKRGKGLDFNVEKSLPETPEVAMPPKRDAGPRKEPPRNLP